MSRPLSPFPQPGVLACTSRRISRNQKRSEEVRENLYAPAAIRLAPTRRKGSFRLYSRAICQIRNPPIHHKRLQVACVRTGHEAQRQQPTLRVQPRVPSEEILEAELDSPLRLLRPPPLCNLPQRLPRDGRLRLPAYLRLTRGEARDETTLSTGEACVQSMSESASMTGDLYGKNDCSLIFENVRNDRLYRRLHLDDCEDIGEREAQRIEPEHVANERLIPEDG